MADHTHSKEWNDKVNKKALELERALQDETEQEGEKQLIKD